MAIVDERGRVFGRINLIDLALVVFVVILVPLGYAAYRLLRPQPPRLMAIAPATLTPRKGLSVSMEVRGESLRPGLKVNIGANEGYPLIVTGPRQGTISVGDLKPGTYDVVLSDDSLEVSRLANALTVLVPPIQIVGSFAAGTPADQWAVGSTLVAGSSPAVELMTLGSADASGVRATLRSQCEVTPESICTVGGSTVQPGATIKLTTSKGLPVTFHVDQLRLDRRWALVRVRLIGLPEALGHVKPGDVDRRQPTGSATAGELELRHLMRGAVIQSIGNRVHNLGSYAVSSSETQGPGRDLSTSKVLNANLTADGQDAVLLVPLEGLRYGDAEMVPGMLFIFETDQYRVQALVLDVPDAAGAPR